MTISIDKQDFGEIRLGRNFNYRCEDDHNNIIPLNYSLMYKFLIQIIQILYLKNVGWSLNLINSTHVVIETHNESVVCLW